jgi:hypothetical protein
MSDRTLADLFSDASLRRRLDTSNKRVICRVARDAVRSGISPTTRHAGEPLPLGVSALMFVVLRELSGKVCIVGRGNTRSIKTILSALDDSGGDLEALVERCRASAASEGPIKRRRGSSGGARRRKRARRK